MEEFKKLINAEKDGWKDRYENDVKRYEEDKKKWGKSTFHNYDLTNDLEGKNRGYADQIRRGTSNFYRNCAHYHSGSPYWHSELLADHVDSSRYLT